MQFQALSPDYPWDQFPAEPITESEKVPSGAPYASVAVTRLCGPNRGVGCEIKLLCTLCGSNPALTMQRVSRKQEGDVDDKVNSDIDIKILFSKVDSPEKKQLWTHNKNKSRQTWRVFKEN